jgi:hypothetical protein
LIKLLLLVSPEAEAFGGSKEHIPSGAGVTEVEMAQEMPGRAAGCTGKITAYAFAVGVGVAFMAGMPAFAVPCQCRVDNDCPHQNQYCALAAPCSASSTTRNGGICMVLGNGGGSVQRLDVPLTTAPEPDAASQEPTLLAPGSGRQGIRQRPK